MAPTIPLQGLRRPLQHREQRLLGGGANRELLNRLHRYLEAGDEQAAAAAEAMAYVVLHDALTTRLLDRRDGALPRFVGRLGKAVESFEAQIR